MSLEEQLRELHGNEASLEHVEQMLDRFASRNGIEGLRLDAQHSVAIETADGLLLTLTYLPDRGGVIASMPMPEALNERPDLLRELLEANLSLRETAGGTFGKMPGESALIFCSVVPVKLDDEDAFERDLAAFTQVGTEWFKEMEMALDLEPEVSAEDALGGSLDLDDGIHPSTRV